MEFIFLEFCLLYLFYFKVFILLSNYWEYNLIFNLFCLRRYVLIAFVFQYCFVGYKVHTILKIVSTFNNKMTTCKNIEKNVAFFFLTKIEERVDLEMSLISALEKCEMMIYLLIKF